MEQLAERTVLCVQMLRPWYRGLSRKGLLRAEAKMRGLHCVPPSWLLGSPPSSCGASMASCSSSSSSRMPALVTHCQRHSLRACGAPAAFPMA